MNFQEIDAQTFEAFASQLEKRSFEQTQEMAALRQSRKYDVKYMALLSSGEVKVAALTYSQAIFGGKTMGIYYGPLYQDLIYLSTFLRELKKYAKKNKVLELTIFPYDDYQLYSSEGQTLGESNESLIALYQKAGFNYQGNTTGIVNDQIFWHYVKDLSGLTHQNLLHSFSKKGRPLVKKANTFGIKIRCLKRDELDSFVKITEETARRRGYQDKGLDYYQKFYDAFKDKAEFTIASLNFHDYLINIQAGQKKLEEQIAKLKERLEHNPQSEKTKNRLRELSSQEDTFIARQKEACELLEKYGSRDVMLAGSLFVYTPQELVYLYSGSYVEFNKFYAPALLQEYAMLKAIDKGIPFYNLLGITGKFDGSDGVLGFKQNFNGHIVRKFSSFSYYPRPYTFELLRLLKKFLGR